MYEYPSIICKKKIFSGENDMEIKPDDNLFNMFDLFQAKTVLGEFDVQSVLDEACQHYKCSRKSLTANMFLAFAYASQAYRDGELH